MTRLLALLLSCFLFSTTGAFAQNLEKYQEHFDQGIDALNEGRFDEGIAAFEQCLVIVPEDATCAYNIACGYSQKNEVDPAFEWLDNATDWGFGMTEANRAHTQVDTDLENLHSDPRFAEIVAKMERLATELEAAIEAEWNEPIVLLPGERWVPEAERAEGDETGIVREDGSTEPITLEGPIGALVVLHDVGGTKRDIATSQWRERAHARGLALVAVSAPLLAARHPSEGMQWFDDFDAFSARPWDAEAPLRPALDALKKRATIDSTRLVLVGVGEGALVAFNAAMRAPRLYAGVLAVDGPVLPNLVESYFANAADAGVKVHGLWDAEGIYGVPGADLAGFLGQTRMALRTAKLTADIESYRVEEGVESPLPGLIEARLDVLVPAVDAEVDGAPVEAGAPADEGGGRQALQPIGAR